MYDISPTGRVAADVCMSRTTIKAQPRGKAFAAKSGKSDMSDVNQTSIYHDITNFINLFL